MGVVVFGLGGTISMTGSGGVVPALSPAELLAAVPGLAATGIDVDVVDLARLPGASVGFAEVAAVAAAVAAGDAEGAVVVQGTDTIEETAYLLDLRHGGPSPIVVTGAMRNPTLAGADGPANLLAALCVAASPAARDLGALVVFADEIHAARRVRKTHTSSIATFASPDTGPLGYVTENRPVVLAGVPRRPVLVPGPRAVRVPVVTLGFDDDGLLLEGLADRADGVVLAALGAGHVPPRLVPLVSDLAARIPVVLASRTGSGPLLTTTYAFPGSESDLLSRGLVSAGFLHPAKARLLLHTLLSASADLDTVRATFARHGS